MDKRQFKECIDAISKFFGSEWPDDALSAAYEQVANESVESLNAAHKRVCLEFSPKPQPPIGRITAIIQQEAGKIRQRSSDNYVSDWDAQKRKDARYAKEFLKPDVSDKHSNQAMRLINATLEGKLNREQIIEGMNHMETLFPGLGWREEAAKLVRHYNREDNPGHWQEDDDLPL